MNLTKIILTALLFIGGIYFLNTSGDIYISYIFLIPAYLISGWEVILKAIKNIYRGKIFDENFLMTIATLGAILIGQPSEAVGVMFFYIIGESLQGSAVRKSRKSIKSLLEIRPEYANLQSGSGITKVNPETVNINDTLIIKPGEKVPLDGIVIYGNSFVDTYALTGESVPRNASAGDTLLGGMINKDGLITLKVTHTFNESSISKILKLVEYAVQKKADTEKFISTFARYYTPVIVVIALLIGILPPLLYNLSFSDWIYRALVILVISCPCALVISIPLGYFGAIGGASRRGILIKGSNFLDALTSVTTIIFDKTGTLTKGVFKVTKIIPFNGADKDDLLRTAAIAESKSNHPIAKSILAAYGKEINMSLLEQFNEIEGEGIQAVINGKNVIAGNDKLLHTNNIFHEECITNGTVVHVAVDQKYCGYIEISDELKENSKKTISRLYGLGIKNILMLTGDNKTTAQKVSEELGIGQFYAELLPADKLKIIERILAENTGKGKTAFVGDGINDAPVIAIADIGIAMGGAGSDAAVEAADIVIMRDDPYKVAEAIIFARRTRKIIWQNIIFALLVKLVFIVMGSFGLATMWEAVFADMGVALLAILNSTRLLNMTKA